MFDTDSDVPYDIEPTATEKPKASTADSAAEAAKKTAEAEKREKRRARRSREVSDRRAPRRWTRARAQDSCRDRARRLPHPVITSSATRTCRHLSASSS